ncbi:MAG: hypothetical protein KAT90_12150 [Gammaproteobacteria bacterium]|nr:hypothetical protein [Gammaproteobacteria bacterium]
MTRPSELAFDSENLTPTEKVCERELSKKRQSCRYCDNLKLHPRSGATVCEEGQDMKAVLRGRQCDYFDVRK